MKTILITVLSAVVIVLGTGCAASTTVGNRDQHGASTSVKTEGHHKGVHASVY